MREEVVLLEDTVLPEQLEESFLKWLNVCGTAKDTKLLIDFGRAKFVDVATFLVCFSIFKRKDTASAKICIGYPQDTAVSNIFNLWRFADGLMNVSGRALEDLIVMEDINLATTPPFPERNKEPGLDALECNDDWDGDASINRNFFEVITYRLNRQRGGQKLSYLDAATPQVESSRWGKSLIKSVLRKHLGADISDDDVPRSVIYESLSNAVRHPNASIVQLCSRFYYSEKADGSQHPASFKICVWDDGDSIPATLLRVLQDGGVVQDFNVPSWQHDKFHVSLRRPFGSGRSHKKKIEIFDPNENITSENATEAKLVLASLCAGVTQRIAHKVPEVDPYGSDDAVPIAESSYISRKGMGLYALLRTVVDQFHGTLIIRTGHVLAEVLQAHDTYRGQFKTHYKAKVQVFQDHTPPFCGNLLSIQIPLK